ncbi:MAG TPA: tetratricopeptide repeat protein [Terracidiphilus sp.]|nr:tetratricopeptide repeat protein [Terracidiphilus sp.]
MRGRARAALAAVLLGAVLTAAGQQTQESQEQISAWVTAGEWQKVADALEPKRARTAEENYAYGTALAHLQRWREADAALEAGERQARRDERFPLQRAGVAFKQKRYPRAARELRRALRLKPDDAYAADFLGTVYFLEDNVPAALTAWNRLGKLELAVVKVEPALKVHPALLDGAFAFAPMTKLTARQLADSEARVRGLGIFAQHHFDLRAGSDGKFDLVFRAEELNGFGQGWLERAFLLARGLPFQEIDPEYDNLRGQAVNLRGMVRWDAQKRRVFAEVAGPWMHSAVRRYGFTLDLRNENWALREGFAGPAPVEASLNLRRAVGSATIGSNARDHFRWRVGAEVSDRELRGVDAGGLLTPSQLARGWELKQTATVKSTLVRAPERRMTVTAEADSDAARLWATPAQGFEKLQGRVEWRWLPRAMSEDYETRVMMRAGGIFGPAPFDELFELGLERDNDLPMRGHIGTRDGVKGSAPLGRDYILASWQTDKTLYTNGLMTVTLGPFVDTGRMMDALAVPGWQKWLTDAGAEARLRVFGTTVAFSYGKDLRTGNNAFYLRLVHED